MAKMVEISIQLDEELKISMEKLCVSYGISIETAFIRFVEESVRRGRLPFELTEEDKAFMDESVNADIMSTNQIHEELQKGYDDIQAGRIQDAASVFKKFREKHSDKACQPENEETKWEKLHERYDDLIEYLNENNPRFQESLLNYGSKIYKEQFDKYIAKNWSVRESTHAAEFLSQKAKEGFAIGYCESIVEHIEELKEQENPDEAIDHFLHVSYGLTLDEAIRYKLI